MKVLFVIDSLGHGGAERSLVEMIPAVRAAGVETVIVALDDRPGPLTQDARHAGATVVHLRRRGLLHRTLELRGIIKRERPTIVHTTLFVSDQIGRLAAFGTGTRVISSLVNTIYDPVRLRDPNVRRHRLAVLRLIDGWTARHLTAHLHAISSAVKESSSRALRVAPDRITVVGRGRDPARLGAPSHERRLRARAALDIPEDAQVILTVGRQEFQKGQEYLVAAFDRLAGSHPQAVLLIAGRPGHATTVLQTRCAQSEHRDRIHILGQRDDVPELLAAADVFAFPSRYEGFGGALVEAMALAVPAVVSDIGALREVVEGTGAVLVPPGDSEALAAGLTRVLDDPAWAADLGARARSMFADHLTTAHSSARMLDLYARIAGHPVPASSNTAAAHARVRPELVSVVVPVLNEVSDLPDQLAALAAQTYCGRWELIVCDNGSVDGTAQLAASWRDRLPNLRVVDVSDRRGVNHVRNIGVEHARGDFIAFCDGDDVVRPEWLHALAEAAPHGDIVGGALDTEDLNGPRTTSPLELPSSLPTKYGFLLGIPGGNCGVWRTVAMELGWDEQFTFGGSDIEFAWRAQLAGYRIAYAPEALISVRHPDGLRTLARQWYSYGESEAKLFRVFRHVGMRRSRVGEAARVWTWLLIHAGGVRGSAQARRRWVRLASYRAGRLAGSARERTLFL